jgi:hypothetical protein
MKSAAHQPIAARDLPLAVTLVQAADLLGCSRPTLTRMLEDESCPVTETRYGDRRFVVVQSLLRFLGTAS